MLESIYVSGTGLYLPPLQSVREAVSAGLYPAQELAETQLDSVPVSTDVFPADMAVLAGRDALSSTGFPSADVTLTLHAHIASQGPIGWHAASYVHHNCVGNNSPSIEVGQMSNGGMAALGLGISHLMASAPDSLVLVTTSDRFEDIPRGRWDFDEGLVPGDGAAACVLSRRGGYARILSYAAHSESGLEGLHRGELKFGREPLAGSATSYRQRKREFLAGKSLIVLARTLRRAMLTVVDRALADAGIALADISRWVLPSFGLQLVHMSYLEPLGIDIKDTCWDLGRTTGHLGAGDQIAGLHFLRDTGAMQPGSKCALIGIGAGFNWSCSVVEFT